MTTQGVVAPETCGVGGDLFALVHQVGEETPMALNASGSAGSAADPAVLREAGHTSVPRDHRLAVTIPGCVDGLVALSERLGSWDLSDCLEPAITVAAEGFPVSREQARAFTALQPVYQDNPAVSSFYPKGEPVNVGDIVRRHDLAATLMAVGEGGRGAFYEGAPGEDMIAALAPHVVAEDLLQPHFEWVVPLPVPIGDDIAWTIPPNSAGYLGPGTVAVFMRLDPPDDPTDPMWWHLLIEAHRSLAWERERVVADPNTAPEDPADLVSEERLDRAAASISRTAAGTWPSRPARPSGTAYMCVADEDGMAVSIINSNYNGTGSPFGAARSGFLLQDRGAGFTLEPGHPNELGPGKRPAHTLSPTIWTNGTDTSWLLGTRGGEIQPQLIAQMAVRAIVQGQVLAAAQEAPRWSMTEYGPGQTSSVSLEPGTGMAAHLERLGHTVREETALRPGWGPISIIDLRSRRSHAASDPRVDTSMALVL